MQGGRSWCKDAGAVVCGSCCARPPVPSVWMGSRPVPIRWQAGAQAWPFTSQQEIGTWREEADRAGKLPVGTLERTRREPWRRSKGKREGPRGYNYCLQSQCHTDVDWFSEPPARDPREMGCSCPRQVRMQSEKRAHRCDIRRFLEIEPFSSGGLQCPAARPHARCRRRLKTRVA